MITIDTSEIRFYLFDSGAFKSLLKAKQPPLLAERRDGILSLDGEHYLFVSNERVEAIQFYVHEFTELVIKSVVMQELETILQIVTDDKKFIFPSKGAQFAHTISQETEGNGQW
jgi:hypothetical protein